MLFFQILFSSSKIFKFKLIIPLKIKTFLWHYQIFQVLFLISYYYGCNFSVFAPHLHGDSGDSDG